MAKLITSAALGAALASRYPNAGGPSASGVLPNLAASQEEGTLEEVQAGAVKGFAQVSGKLVWIEAIEHFFVKGELISIGDLVQVPANESRHIIDSQRAVAVTDAEVADAQKSK